ncbi:MAG: hypothetical protein C0596_16145 [Marinilabiliales bacterium]|nr:MAG: hypothetical protein C0596_16145 [Marinilabiliales bacterium]
MPKLKNILIIVAVILSFGIAYKLYKRLKDTEKLKLGATSLKAAKKLESFSDLKDIFINGFAMKGYIEVRNFSDKDYTIDQLSLDCYSPKSNKLVAEQTNILPKSVVLKSRQTTNIPLEYNVDLINSLSLFKESDLIPADTTVWQIVTEPSKYCGQINLRNLKVKLIGFIQAEGITLSVNEDYLLL